MERGKEVRNEKCVGQLSDVRYAMRNLPQAEDFAIILEIVPIILPLAARD